jgi:hypothetical protein
MLKIIQSGIINVYISCPVTVIGNTVLSDVYGLEMIIALAFRIRSYNAEVLRKWTIWKVSKMELQEILKLSVQNPALN